MEKMRVELCVHADKSMRLVIRMTTSGVMSRVGFTLDEMDDMKMAVDEACNLMMLQKPSCRQLAIRYEYDEQSMEIHIDGRDAVSYGDDEKPDANMQEVIRCILESIVDEVRLVSREDGGTQEVFLKKNILNRRRSAV